jgi:hypothetical protein
MNLIPYFRKTYHTNISEDQLNWIILSITKPHEDKELYGIMSNPAKPYNGELIRRKKQFYIRQNTPERKKLEPEFKGTYIQGEKGLIITIETGYNKFELLIGAIAVLGLSCIQFLDGLNLKYYLISVLIIGGFVYGTTMISHHYHKWRKFNMFEQRLNYISRKAS